MKKEEAEELIKLLKEGKSYNKEYENGDADARESMKLTKEGVFRVIYSHIPWDCNSVSQYSNEEYNETEFLEFLLDTYHKLEEMKEYIQ